MAAENREKAEPSRGKSPSSPVRRKRTAFSLHIERNAYGQRLRHWNSGCTRLCDSYLIFTFPFTQTLDWLIKRNDYLFCFLNLKRHLLKQITCQESCSLFSSTHPTRELGLCFQKTNYRSSSFPRNPWLAAYGFSSRKDKPAAATGLLQRNLKSVHLILELKSPKKFQTLGPGGLLQPHFLVAQIDFTSPILSSAPLDSTEHSHVTALSGEATLFLQVASSSSARTACKGRERRRAFVQVGFQQKRTQTLARLGVFQLLSMQLSTGSLVPTP